MKKLLLFLISFCFFSQSQAQKIINRDPQISNLVAQVSKDSLQDYIQHLVAFGTRATLSSTSDAKQGIGAARRWVLNKFNEFAKNSDGRMTATIDTWQLKPDGKRVDKDQEIGNVIATLKGTDPNDNRVYIISGHLDSRVSDIMNRVSDAPGANDDGSGTVAVIEAARVLSKAKFPATILFVVFSGEEQGSLGAEHMATRVADEKWNLDAVLNNDIMGSNHSNETNIIDNTRLRVFSEGLPAFEMDKKVGTIRQYGWENDGKSRQLARYIKEVGERYVDNLEVVLIYRNDRFLRGGDHTPFVSKGFAAIRISEMNENFLHQHQDLRIENGKEYGDLPKFMDFEYLRKNTCINLASLANLAKAPAMPQEVVIDVKGLGNSTTMGWKAPQSGKTKGYYVLVRETSQAMWQKKIFTKDLKITLPISKDNYFFAVQSVSEEDNESLPVIPRVEK